MAPRILSTAGVFSNANLYAEPLRVNRWRFHTLFVFSPLAPVGGFPCSLFEE